MTREQAIEKVHNSVRDRKMVDKGFYASDLVDALIALDILKVEEPVPDSVAAVQALEKLAVWIVGTDTTAASGWQNHGVLTPASAQDIVGRLLKSGFKIIK